jgi:Ca2+-binding RTX toxin-like protein
VTVFGTNNDDAVVVFGSGSGVSVLELAATVNIVGSESTDRLTINTLQGADVVAANGLAAGVTSLTVDGGEGDDVLIGSDGNDTLIGSAGDDVLEGGPGLDVLNGAPGDDILLQD